MRKRRRAGQERRDRAVLLSRGIAEQVYLLLRAALAQHLTSKDEVCPLILDDVTVHCDSSRKPHILNTLHALSQERQIILFTQEEAVVEWAKATLSPTSGREEITRLDPAATPSTGLPVA